MIQKPAAGRWAQTILVTMLLASPPAFADWHMQQFLILYSSGWPAEQVQNPLTDVLLRRIKEANYNTVMCEESQLELLEKARLGCLVIGRSGGEPNWAGEAVSPATARSLAGNPVVWGYYIMDEPDNENAKRGSLFRQLAGKVVDFRTSDPHHLAWINKSSATGGFLADYMAIVKPDLLSFDLYRWWASESDWWRGLEAHREAALKADVPMVQWIESNSSEKRFRAHLAPPTDNARKIRWSVYTSLAYGSKGIQWFLGSTDPDVAALNHELSVMGPTLVKLKSERIFHTSDVPREGRRLPDSQWYFTESKNLLIGEFSNPEDSAASYLLIANKSVDNDADAVFELKRRSSSVVEEIGRRTPGRTLLPTTPHAGAERFTLHLPAGDGRLLRVAFL